jgi:hypothetical protein
MADSDCGICIQELFPYCYYTVNKVIANYWEQVTVTKIFALVRSNTLAGTRP